jgi:WD40 repeat protein/serine/threonine protein kinase
MSESFERELAVFNAARRLPDDQREEYLDQACTVDFELRQHVEELLRAGEEAGAFLQAPAPGAQLRPNPATSSSLSLQSPVAAEKPVERIGSYKLLQQLGEGGCGVVYMAEQEEPIRRRVALKIIKLGMDTKQVIARFEAERQALALMDHPNIAKVLDAGATENGRPYFVMELVRGLKITDYCDERNLTTRERLQVFIQVCQAIQHAHQKGIIHRDIKPSNILVTISDGVAVPKVIDFGIAKATQGPLTDQTLFTAFEQFIGTPAYMSPEQSRLGELDIDTRTDVYSLGVLLYESLTGRTPFDAKALLEAGLDEMRRTIQEEEPVRPSTKLTTMASAELAAAATRRGVEALRLVQLMRGDLDWIIMRCLEKNRARRYETASALAMDIQRYLSHQPVLARPPSRVYRAKKFISRNKAMATVAAITATVLLLGGIVSTWQAIRATRAEHASQKAQAKEIQQRQRAEAGEKLASQNLYAAQMDLAQQVWEQNNVGRLRQLLDESAGYSQRAFEWYYWQRQTHLEFVTLRGHADVIRAVAFSPDGRRIVTGSWDRTAKVWETASGKELLTLKGHPSGISSVAFSPDGQRIVTGSDDQSAKVWDAFTGIERVTLRGHAGWIRSVAFSPDGQRIVTGSDDQTAKVWDSTTGKELLTLSGHKDEVFSVAFSPNGLKIVTGSHDRTARVWESASAKELLTLIGHQEAIKAVAFSADGQRIITGSLDRTAKVWEAGGGKELFTLQGHANGVMSVAFSPDCQLLVTGSADHSAKIWETTSGKELFTLRGHNDAIRSVAFSPDGQWVVTGSDDCTAKVWAAKTNEPLTLRGHTATVCAVAFSADGLLIGTGSKDHAAKLWDGTTGRQLLTLKGHHDWVTCLAFSPDGTRIATGSHDKTAKLWETTSAKELLTIPGSTSEISSVAFSSVNLTIVPRADDETAKVLDALNLKGPGGLVSPLALSSNRRWIVTGAGDPTAKVWDAATGNELVVLRGHSRAIRCGTFSPDGQRIVTGSDDQTAKVWDTSSGRELLTLRGHSAGVAVVAFSPDGQRIVTGSDDQTAKIWQAATPQQVNEWQAQDRRATDRLAVLSGNQVGLAEQDWTAQDLAAIKQWLVLAPIAYQGRNGSAGLEQEQIPHEANLHPRAGARVKVGEREHVWREVQLQHNGIDFNQLLGEETERCVAYAVCYIDSESARSDLLMKVGSDDQAKVYLNGKEIFRREESRNYIADQDVVPGVEFKTGLNVLVFKVVNETLQWKGSVRFTDIAGRPLRGIRVTTSWP